LAISVSQEARYKYFMAFDNLPWARLIELRDSYLSEKPLRQDYWSDEELLELYEQSLGQRILWKWQAVLEELKFRGIGASAETTIVDWGCGSGIASRAFLGSYLGSQVQQVFLYDRSEMAQQWAKKLLLQDFAKVQAEVGLPVPVQAGDAQVPALLLLSHVLTELDTGGLALLMGTVRSVGAFVWVEPGTSRVGRELPRLRDELLKEGWQVLAPCGQMGGRSASSGAKCGLFAAGKEADWCHSFVAPPSYVHHEPFWAEFRKRLGIDFRRTPYSVLVMKKPANVALNFVKDTTANHPSRSFNRLIGEARHYKGFSKLLLCGEKNQIPDQIFEQALQKKAEAGLIKKLKSVPGIADVEQRVIVKRFS